MQSPRFFAKSRATGLQSPCSAIAPPLCQPSLSSPVLFAGRNAKAPSIYIFSPPSEQLTMQESATITCLVKGFNPPDLFVRWLRNGEPLPTGDYITMPPVAESQPAVSYFTYSSLTVSGEDWRAGNIFTCLVGHEQIPLQVAQKSVDKASGKPTSVNVSLVLSDAASACY